MTRRAADDSLQRDRAMAHVKAEVAESLAKLNYFEDIFQVLGELTTMYARSLYRQGQDQKDGQ